MSITVDTLVFTAFDLQDNVIELPFPTEFEIVKSFDSPAQSFEGIFPCTKAYPELYALHVYAGTQRIFKGLLDEQTMSENDTGCTIKLMARSAGGILLDNEVLPQIYDVAYLQEMFENYIQPYNISLRTQMNPFISGYQIVKGTSAWEAFKNFCQHTYTTTTFINDEDELICMNGMPKGRLYHFSNRDAAAHHYTNLKVTNNRYVPVSQIVIRSPEGVYDRVYDYFGAQRLKIRRRRYLIPDVKFLDPDAGYTDAMYRAGQAMLGKLVITLTCVGMMQVCVSDRVDLDTGLERYEKMFVHQVRYRLMAGGITTTLTLLRMG